MADQAIKSSQQQLSEARKRLMELAPQLASHLASDMPALYKEFLLQLRNGLRANVLITSQTAAKDARPRRVAVPNWDLRKFCMGIVHDLAGQALDRGGAPRSSATEVSGTLATGYQERVASMSTKEINDELARLEGQFTINGKSLVPGGNGAASAPQVREGSKRSPIIPR